MSFATDPCEWLEIRRAQNPELPFLRTPSGRRLSYGELHQQSGAWAAALLARGVRTGERVAVQVDKSVESILLYVACLRIGAVYCLLYTSRCV